MTHKIIYFDVECDSNFAYVGILIDNDYSVLSISEFLHFLMNEKNCIFVGFNCSIYKGYDLPLIIAYYLKYGKDSTTPLYYENYKAIKELTEEIINYKHTKVINGLSVDINEWTNFVYKKLEPTLLSNGSFLYDLRDTYGSGSLKLLSFYKLNYKYAQTSDKLNYEYNLADLKNTKGLFEYDGGLNCRDSIESIMLGMKMFDIPASTLNTTVLVNKFIGKYIGVVVNDDNLESKAKVYVKKQKDKSWRTKWGYEYSEEDVIDNSYVLQKYINIDDIIRNVFHIIGNAYPKLKDKFECLHTKPILTNPTKAKPKPSNIAYIMHKVNIKNKIYLPLGLGGIHYDNGRVIDFNIKDKPYYYYNVDFTSFYPSIYIMFNLFGDTNTTLLKSMMEERIKIKHTNKAKATILKLILNTLFGQLCINESSIYMTSLAQVLIIELIELMDTFMDNMEVIDVNTDGIIIKTTTPTLKDFGMNSRLTGDELSICTDDTLLQLEVESIDNYLLYENSNNYAWEGKYKGGAFKSVDITNSMNMPSFHILIHKAFTDDYNVDDSLFKCIYNTTIFNNEVYYGSTPNYTSGLGYGYVTKLRNKPNGNCTPQALKYRMPECLGFKLVEGELPDDIPVKCFKKTYDTRSLVSEVGGLSTVPPTEDEKRNMLFKIKDGFINGGIVKYNKKTIDIITKLLNNKDYYYMPINGDKYYTVFPNTFEAYAEYCTIDEWNAQIYHFIKPAKTAVSKLKIIDNLNIVH